MDPVERVRFQVTRARNNKRLDLSTWANRKQGDFLLSRVPRTVSTANKMESQNVTGAVVFLTR